MVKKTFLKECFRSIRGSFSRFLAIFLIVALGAGFLAGLLATTPDMRHTVSELYRETNLFDLRIAGNLGLEDTDVQALAAVPGVRAVMPARSLDREITLSTGDMLAARFHGVTAWEGSDPALMNRSSLVEGRWPQSSDECVIEMSSDLYQGGLAVGQKLTVLPLEADEDEEEPDEPFTVRQFTIVGVVSTSYYISMVQRGSTTMGSGTLGAIVYVPDQVLDMDYYTDLYATVVGGDSAEAFTQAYEDLVVPIREAVEDMAETQKHVRADRLRAEAQEELDEAKQELADKTAEGEQELADALKELEDGEQEYADGLQELEDGRQELADALTAGLALGGHSVIEQYISGREIQVGILEDRALPSIEIIPKVGFYDYENKYQPGAAEEICPAPIPAEWETRLAEQAMLVFRTLGLSVYSRADFIVTEDGTPWFLEINTLPGMTPTSLLPQEAAAVGIGYGELCERIIKASLEARKAGK